MPSHHAEEPEYKKSNPDVRSESVRFGESETHFPVKIGYSSVDRGFQAPVYLLQTWLVYHSYRSPRGPAVPPAGSASNQTRSLSDRSAKCFWYLDTS